MPSKNIVEDQLTLNVTLPTSVLVISDIHLSGQATKASHNVEKVIGQRIAELTKLKSANIVLNGDIFELWAGKEPSVTKALLAHPRLTKALQEFGQKSHHGVIFTVGNHDGRLGWDNTQQQILIDKFDAQICFSLQLKIKTGKSTRSILFEHGHMLDSDNAFTDPRDPNDKPFGQYLVQEALPMAQATQGSMLDGINHLAEPHKFAKFVASRLMYREIFNRLWWLIVPLVIILATQLLVGYGAFAYYGMPTNEVIRIIIYTSLVVISSIAVILTAIALIARKILARAKTMPGGHAGEGHNEAARTKAKAEINKSNTIGLITGHTHRPVINDFGEGFFANSGCGVEMIYTTKAHLGLPNTYVSLNQLSWLELTLDKDQVNIVLWQMSEDNRKQSKLERFVTKPTQLDKPLRASHKHTFKY